MVNSAIHGIFCWFLDTPPVIQHFMLLSRWLHIVFTGLWLALGMGIAMRGGGGVEYVRLYRWAAIGGFLFGLNLLHMRYGFPTRWWGAGVTGQWMITSAAVGCVVLLLAAVPVGRNLASGDPQKRALGIIFNFHLLMLCVPVSLGMVAAAHGGLGWESTKNEIAVSFFLAWLLAWVMVLYLSRGQRPWI